jgi:hypothetical protein
MTKPVPASALPFEHAPRVRLPCESLLVMCRDRGRSAVKLACSVQSTIVANAGLTVLIVVDLVWRVLCGVAVVNRLRNVHEAFPWPSVG